MNAPISRIRSAWNATLFTHSTGKDQDALGAMFGLPRPSTISRAAWRRALLAAGLGYRGEPSCTWFFIEGALSDYAVDLTVVLDPSRPTQLVSPTAEFTQDLVGRFVRLPAYGLFRVQGPEDVDTYYSERLDLVPYATSYWQAPDWSTLVAPLEVEASFLPFDVREDQRGRGQTVGDDSGTTTVYLYSDELQGVPPTFMQEGLFYEIASVDTTAETLTTAILNGLVADQPVNFAPTIDEGAPIAVDSVSGNTITTDAAHGLSNDDALILLPGTDGVLPAPLSSDERYYAIVVDPDEVQLASAPGGAAITLTDTGTLPFSLYLMGVLPAPLDEETTYFATPTSPFAFTVSETEGGGTVNLTDTGTAPFIVAPARPVGQDAGGIIMEDAFASGNPETPSTGPYPLFVASDETLFALREVFRNILPAGLKIKFVYIPPYGAP